MLDLVLYSNHPLFFHRLQATQPLQPPTADASQLSGSIGTIPATQAAQDHFPPNVTIPPPQIRTPSAQPMPQPTVSVNTARRN